MLIGASLPSGEAAAQITSDTTLSTTVTSPNGLDFTITNGDRTGNNLFHSFDQFSVPTNGSAVFDHAIDIDAIFSRVTGGASTIDGLIQASGIADLFLLNPRGIIFGPNASLTIGGSFVATTADGVLFNNNQSFSATNTTAPLLTLSTPIGLQFKSPQGSMTVQGNGHNLDLDLDTFQPIRDNRPAGLQVNENQTLALIGGDILFEGGNLTANQGRIELGSVAQPGNVSLLPTADGYTVDYGNIEDFGNLSFTQSSSVEVSGPGSGNLHFQAGTISVVDESAIISNVLGAEDGGNVLVRAADSVEIMGTEIGDFPSAFFNNNEPGSTGNAGNLRLETDKLQIANNTFIDSSTAGAGNGGDLTIIASDIDINGETEIYPGYDTGLFAQVLVGGTGQGGDLTINAQNALFRDGAFIATTTNDIGDAGDLKIAAEIIEVIGTTVDGDSLTLITTDSNASGQGGDLLIETNYLRVTDGGQLAAGTFGDGDGGTFRVNANRVDVIGSTADGGYSSGLFVDTLSSGNGGNLVINAEQLNVLEGGDIFAGTLGEGNGGNLEINAQTVNVAGLSPGLFASNLSVGTVSSGDAGNLVINTEQFNVTNGGNIVATTEAEGNGGNITVYASESINVIGKNQLGNNFSIITSATGDYASGTGGNVILETPYLSVAEGGSISAATFGNGDGGSIAVQADIVEISDAALDFSNVLNGIVTFVAPESFDFEGNEVPAATGNGGDIAINANQLMINRGGQIDSSTFGVGTAGNINLTADTVTLTGISEVLADGTQIPSRIISLSDTDGAAGTIQIAGDSLTVQDGAEINVSSSAMGDAGNLNLLFNTVRLDRQGRLLAEVNGGAQGNIIVTAAELLLLRRGGAITTNATNTSTGGNIVINSPIILGIPDENSDIAANAMQGNGGNITIQTQGLWGLEFRTSPTPQSDITVSSESGIDGTVTIVSSLEEFTSDALELPENFRDSNNQVATTCSPGNNTFMMTGRGGIFPSGDILRPTSLWLDQRNLLGMAGASMAESDQAESLTTPDFSPPPPHLPEATGIAIAPDGTVELTMTRAHQLPYATCANAPDRGGDGMLRPTPAS